MTRREVTIPAQGLQLAATLGVPAESQGLVIFAHGSGSGRFSPRNAAVASALQERKLSTLLADLLSEEEASDQRHVFDIDLLARRVEACARWAGEQDHLRTLPFGVFGASTGAAAALVAAARPDSVFRAVVSRGGRPDLAGQNLRRVRAPTLLIVGGDDLPVIRLNKEALAQLAGERELAVIPGATHLFEEPGALGQVAKLAADWFLRFLPLKS